MGEIPARGGEQEEEPEGEEIVFLGGTAAAAAIEGHRAGNRRFHLGMMSPPTSIPVFPLDLGIFHKHLKCGTPSDMLSI